VIAVLVLLLLLRQKWPWLDVYEALRSAADAARALSTVLRNFPVFLWTGVLKVGGDAAMIPRVPAASAAKFSVNPC
jgi:hypothetical protein